MNKDIQMNGIQNVTSSLYLFLRYYFCHTTYRSDGCVYSYEFWIRMKDATWNMGDSWKNDVNLIRGCNLNKWRPIDTIIYDEL